VKVPEEQQSSKVTNGKDIMVEIVTQECASAGSRSEAAAASSRSGRRLGVRQPERPMDPRGVSLSFTEE